MKYEIVVEGNIPDKYINWLNGTRQFSCNMGLPDGKFTTFFVKAADQSQLRGVLTKIFDLNLSLVQVKKFLDNEIEGENDA